MQQRIVAVFNKAVKAGKLKANPFYMMDKCDTFSACKQSNKQFLTPDELKLFMSSVETSPGVAEAQRAFGFACLTGLRISDIKALRWGDIIRDVDSAKLVIAQKKTQALNAVPICSKAMEWLPEQGNDMKVFHLPANANVDAAIKRIAKKVGLKKTISFHTSRHTFGTLVQAATGDIETTKKLMGHKSLKSTVVYADVLTEEKVKAIDHTKAVFKDRKLRAENTKIPKTRRTAATNRHPRRILEMQENE
jgi:integrase